MKTLFNICALIVGGTGTLIGGIGLLTNKFNTASQSGGVDLTLPAVVITLACAGLFYKGYKGIKNSQNNDSNNPKP